MSSNVIDNYFTETDPEIINLLLEVLKLDKVIISRGITSFLGKFHF